MNDRFLIVGLGSIGRRHLECLREIRPTADITVWRQYHRDTAVPDGANRVVFSLEDALACKPVCAIVANPASMHVAAALALAESGVHLMVEKPLSDSLQDVERLISICETNELVLMVAYVLRFNEGLNIFRQAVQAGKIGRVLSFRAEVGQYLPDWRPGSDYRTSVSASRELGGGALLELSHELDYIRWVFGEVVAVSASITNTGTLDMDVEDLVEGILEMRSPEGLTMTGSVHLDMLQHPPYRICRAVGKAGTLEWNAIEGMVRCFDPESKAWQSLYQSASAGRNSAYMQQLESFLDAVWNKQPPMVTGGDGRSVLQIIRAMRDSAVTRQQVSLL